MVDRAHHGGVVRVRRVQGRRGDLAHHVLPSASFALRYTISY
jgi:hypothetical protein